MEKEEGEIVDNEQLAKLLELLSVYYKLAKDKYRTGAYEKAAYTIRNSEEEITSGAQALQLPGIGQSIATDIEQYLQTGKIDRLQQLEYKYQVVKPVLDKFMAIYGIGPVTAVGFYEKGFRTVDDLWYKANLTEAQKNGILWRDHLSERIPRAELDLINEIIGEIFTKNGINYVITGSYRRGEASSGDIDILIEAQEGIDMDLIIELLDQYIPTILAKGEKKFAGIFRLSEDDWGRRLDILLIKPESWPYALLHFTGSGKFNILMRNKAKSLGMKLSEYGLKDKNGHNLPAETEEDIFNYLHVNYIPPEQRSKSIKSI